jgi:hypothetical protein
LGDRRFSQLWGKRMTPATRWHCLARLDYDSREQLADGLERMRWVRALAADNGFYCGPYRMLRHRTRRGYHVELFAQCKIEPAQMVALQSILGSDYRRETFNLFRARMLPLAPGFWRQLGHWNVLHKGAL